MTQEHFAALDAQRGLNDIPLSPLSLLSRTADVHPSREAVIYGTRRYTWAGLQQRVRRLAGALAAHGVGQGDTVSVIASNTPELLEAHYGVPLCGAVLNAINIRLDADTIAYILQHADCKLLLVDTEFLPVVKQALEHMVNRPDVIEIPDLETKPALPASGEFPCYEEWVEIGRAHV